MTEANTDFVVLLDGALEATPALKAMVKKRRAIAADGGIRHAQTLGLTPELWVGDFDSADAQHLQQYPSVKRSTYPAEKALSDGELAIVEAMNAGAKDIILAGALGGPRTDHVFFHALMACRITRTHDLKIQLTDGKQVGVPIRQGQTHKPFTTDGQTFSIVGFSQLEGLTIKHAKWPLDAVEAPLGSTLTLSNIAQTDTEITLTKGVAMLFIQLVR
ncbi:MAG: thiamine diphosphokinase [Pseudomonadota bacterium]